MRILRSYYDLVILHGDLASCDRLELYGCTDVQTKLGARACD